MLKASVRNKDGHHLLILGISLANVEHLRQGPGDHFVKVHGAELGVPVDVMIFYGDTEADMTETIKQLIGPDTELVVDRKLKQ